MEVAIENCLRTAWFDEINSLQKVGEELWVEDPLKGVSKHVEIHPSVEGS